MDINTLWALFKLSAELGNVQVAVSPLQGVTLPGYVINPSHFCISVNAV